MRMRLPAVLALGAVLTATPAWAIDLDFDEPKLGSHKRALPPGLNRGRHCVSTPRYTDCGFWRADGTIYSVYGVGVTQKQIRRVGGRFRRSLPFGLEGDDSVVTARRKLEGLGAAVSVFDHGPGDRGLAAMSANAEGVDTAFSVRFDAAGQLQSVRVSCCWN